MMLLDLSKRHLGVDIPLDVMTINRNAVPMVRAKTDPRPAEVLNLLNVCDGKHRDRRFTGEQLTGFGDLSW
jgi:hypothetical protein